MRIIGQVSTLASFRAVRHSQRVRSPLPAPVFAKPQAAADQQLQATSYWHPSARHIVSTLVPVVFLASEPPTNRPTFPASTG